MSSGNQNPSADELRRYAFPYAFPSALPPGALDPSSPTLSAPLPSQPTQQFQDFTPRDLSSSSQNSISGRPLPQPTQHSMGSIGRRALPTPPVRQSHNSPSSSPPPPPPRPGRSLPTPPGPRAPRPLPTPSIYNSTTTPPRIPLQQPSQSQSPIQHVADSPADYSSTFSHSRASSFSRENQHYGSTYSHSQATTLSRETPPTVSDHSNEPLLKVSEAPLDEDSYVTVRGGTPTPRRPGPFHLEAPDTRQRTVSSSSVYTAQLPPTPKALPMASFERDNSFLDGPNIDSPSGSGPTHRETRQSIPARQTSTGSSLHVPSRSSMSSSVRRSSELSPSWAEQSQPPARWVQSKLELHQADRDSEEEWEEEEEDEEEVEVNEIRFFNPAFLSEAALQLRDRVARGRHVKAGIAWVGSFTGRDIVTTIQSFLPPYTRDSIADRRFALIMAQSLQNQLWFVEVDWDVKPMQDSAEDVFRFMGEMEGIGSGGHDALTGELPSGLMTMATKCYSPSCTCDNRCYSPRCPYKLKPDQFLSKRESIESVPAESLRYKEEWTDSVDPRLLRELSPEQIQRQTIIRQAIAAEEQYEADLTSLEKMFILPLRYANPPIFPARDLDSFIWRLFSNVLRLREACRRLIEDFSIRQREQAPFIRTVGDIFLEAVADFRTLYPDYLGNYPNADRLLTKTLEENTSFRLFVEQVGRGADRRLDLRNLLTRPSTHLQRYPIVIEAILNATSPDDPDRDFLVEALSSIQNIYTISQLKLFHASGGIGPASQLKYYDLISEEYRQNINKKELDRQMQIWEVIQTEMQYVTDLELIETVFINGLREADKPIIERSRLETFVDDIFHNYRSILDVHSRLLENLQQRQIEQHPQFGMISDLILDAALNWQDAYMEYIPHYPIAKARADEELAKNPKFAAFIEECMRVPAIQRHELDHFMNRAPLRLLRYPLMLKEILRSLKATPGMENNPDIETIPQILELIDNLAKASSKGVAVNEAKVELWKFQQTLDPGKFSSRTVGDLDLLNPMRELIHRGKVFRQPEGTIGGSWSELYLLLFDHYFVLVKPTKVSSKTGAKTQMRYIINRRPIPLELLSLGNFSEAAQTRSLGMLKNIRGAGASHDAGEDSQSDSRTVYPFTFSFIGQGQSGGQYTLWTDSARARSEWLEKLQHAKVLRREVNDAGKVFEMTPLSLDTFFMAPSYSVQRNDDDYTGRVTCSVPFVTVDGRKLVAVGCQEGVYIGVRHDPKSLRKVLHVRSVTQISVLEEFGIFLVLADKSLLAYHLEALVPSSASLQVRSAPQRLSGVRDILFFTVGQISGRTLVLYMKRKGVSEERVTELTKKMDSVFRVLEPVLNRNVEDAGRQRRPFGSLLGQRTDWFRVFKDFFIPTEATNVHFLKAKLSIVCAKGFEIMDLTNLKGGSIPIFDPNKTPNKPALTELARRCESAKPLAMFRSTETEFLLCYDSFGVYVDRHGEPNRDLQPIEWEGRPESAAFHPPYLLLISPSFIEVRHIDNGKLLQIYTGSDIRLTWDGTSGTSKSHLDAPGPKGWGDETRSQEPRIHICQRPEDPHRTRGIGQHVFELTPTLLLNNPLLNPIHTNDSNYFPPAPMIQHRSSSVTTTSSEAYGALSSYTPSIRDGYVGGAPVVNGVGGGGYGFGAGGGGGGGGGHNPQATPVIPTAANGNNSNTSGHASNGYAPQSYNQGYAIHQWNGSGQWGQ